VTELHLSKLLFSTVTKNKQYTKTSQGKLHHSIRKNLTHYTCISGAGASAPNSLRQLYMWLLRSALEFRVFCVVFG